MAVLPVLRFPDPRLKQPAAPVGSVDAAALALVGDLLDTMRASPACVGLAATQVGAGRRAFVVDVSGHRKGVSNHGQIVLFDPEVVEAAAPVVAREGCLSVPDLTGDVARATVVVVRGLGAAGAPLTVKAEGFEARALLHEIDHLDGLLFLDRVESHAAVFRRRVYR